MAQTRLVSLRQRSCLGHEERLHGAFYCVHTQPKFGATFLQGWLYVFDSALVFDANLLAVNRVQCVISYQDIRVMRKRTLLRINNTIAVEWDDCGGTSHYEIFTSFMSGSRGRAFNAMMEQWSRISVCRVQANMPINGVNLNHSDSYTDETGAANNLNQQWPPQQLGPGGFQGPLTATAAAATAGFAEETGNISTCTECSGFPKWPPLLAQSQCSSDNAEAVAGLGTSGQCSCNDTVCLGPVEVLGCDVDTFAQVLLSDQSGFLPAAYQAQGNVIHNDAQGLTRWQVVPDNQEPHAGALSRTMKFLHTTADNYKADVTQQQLLWTTPEGKLVLQIKQTICILNAFALDVGRFFHTVIRWEVAPLPTVPTGAAAAAAAAAAAEEMPSRAPTPEAPQTPDVQEQQQFCINNTLSAAAAASSSRDSRPQRRLFGVDSASIVELGLKYPYDTPNSSRSCDLDDYDDHTRDNSTQLAGQNRGVSEDSSITGSSGESSSSRRGSFADAAAAAAAALTPVDQQMHLESQCENNAAAAAPGPKGVKWCIHIQIVPTSNRLPGFVREKSLEATAKTLQAVMSLGQEWLQLEDIRQPLAAVLPNAEAALAAAAAAAAAAAVTAVVTTQQTGGLSPTGSLPDHHSRQSSCLSLSFTQQQPPSSGDAVLVEQLVPEDPASQLLLLPQSSSTTSSSSTYDMPRRGLVLATSHVIRNACSCTVGAVTWAAGAAGMAMKHCWHMLNSHVPATEAAAAGDDKLKWQQQKVPYGWFRCIAVLLVLQLVLTWMVLKELCKVVELQEYIIRTLKQN